MSARTSIAWCDASWNPVVGCSRVSAGCEHCYAERFAHRWRNIDGHALGGLTRESGGWNGVVRMNEKALGLPLRWRKPKRIFVNSMSDLFHESLSDEQIDEVFAVMALAPQHVFQVLTKRPERMREYVGAPGRAVTVIVDAHDRAADLDTTKGKRLPASVKRIEHPPWYRLNNAHWPLTNVWLGVSAEDQATADERIPLLLQTPAAKRFVSYEPALGPVDFARWMPHAFRPGDPEYGWERQCAVLAPDGLRHCGYPSDAHPRPSLDRDGVRDLRQDSLEDRAPRTLGLDLVIVGGESGPGARPCDVAWIRSTVEQCKAAGVACFVKQLGARSYSLAGDSLCANGDPPVGSLLSLTSRAGSDPSEWPEDLRVQEWPR